MRDNLLISLLAAGVVAVIFQPLRERLQRGVNHMIYGERDDPYNVLARLGRRLEAVVAPQEVLPTVVETVAQALRLPYAAIALREKDGFKVAAEYTQPASPLAASPPLPGRENDEKATMKVFPLRYQNEVVGQMILSPRAPGEEFSTADEQLLRTIARHAGAAAHAVRLTADLQRSREHLVTAREEERRRLRHNLHDDIGPSLASLTLGVDAARNMLLRDPSATEATLVQLKAQIQTLLADIRRIASDLRPPALDELGLLPALRERIASYTHTRGLQITLKAPEALPRLSAALEVAVYRIVLEALTNVIRHAQARHCRIHITLDEALHIEIHDDGIGLPEDIHAGIGLHSMSERAAELGGTCTIHTDPNGGTRVYARLPLRTGTAQYRKENTFP